MSRTIRNEQTKGYLDKLATERKTRKLIRDLKQDLLLNIDNLSTYTTT